MDLNDKKTFKSFQQGELNAVLMYRKFAEITKNSSFKEAYLEAAKDEGRHASILSKYTQENLKPNEFQAKLLGVFYRILPKKLVHYGISLGEYGGGKNYRPYNKEIYPEIEGMIKDEYKHGDMFKELSKKF